MVIRHTCATMHGCMDAEHRIVIDRSAPPTRGNEAGCQSHAGMLHRTPHDTTAQLVESLKLDLMLVLRTPCPGKEVDPLIIILGYTPTLSIQDKIYSAGTGCKCPVNKYE